MSLFEDWYITYTGYSEKESEYHLLQDVEGKYVSITVCWMYKAFLAGQILCEEER